MPRLVESVPKYRKHSRSGQAIVTINGRAHYLGPHGTKVSRNEYDRLIAEWLSSGRSSSYGKPTRQLSIAELLLAYLQYARAYYGDGPRGELVNMKLALKPLRSYTDSSWSPVSDRCSSRQFGSDLSMPGCAEPTSMGGCRGSFAYFAGPSPRDC